MLSLEIDNPPQPPPKKKSRFGPWLLTFVVLILPLLWMTVGRLTAPPHAAGFPTGHLIFLDADQPSERTTMLRGLYLVSPDGASRLLVHESEPQDTDAGSRIWITQPSVSPDGQSVAYVRQIYTLQQEHRTVSSEIWMVGTAPGSKPRQVYDPNKEKLKGIVGLAWTPDSKAVDFLNDGVLYSAPIAAGSTTKQQPLRVVPALAASPDISATRLLRIAPDGAPFYLAQGTGGMMLVAGEKQYSAPGPVAVSPDGLSIALARPGRQIEIIASTSGQVKHKFTARWGWSPFGRALTRLVFSPDGQYLAYSVSKHPVPEDELFYLDLRSGQVRQIPARAGSSAWDWGS